MVLALKGKNINYVKNEILVVGGWIGTNSCQTRH